MRHNARRAHFGRSYRGDWLALLRQHGMAFYDRQGRRITYARYAALVERRMRYKRVAFTTLPNPGVRVSTVWLGMDHNFWFSGPPLIFETMVFPLDSFSDLAMWRYETERDARKGHNQAVHLARTGEVDVSPWDDADTPQMGRSEDDDGEAGVLGSLLAADAPPRGDGGLPAVGATDGPPGAGLPLP